MVLKLYRFFVATIGIGLIDCFFFIFFFIKFIYFLLNIVYIIKSLICVFFLLDRRAIMESNYFGLRCCGIFVCFCGSKRDQNFNNQILSILFSVNFLTQILILTFFFHNSFQQHRKPKTRKTEQIIRKIHPTPFHSSIYNYSTIITIFNSSRSLIYYFISVCFYSTIYLYIIYIQYIDKYYYLQKK